MVSVIQAFWTDAMKMGNSYSFSFGYGITLYDSDGNLIKAKSDRPFVILAGNNEYQPKGANRTFEAICTTRRASCTGELVYCSCTNCLGCHCCWDKV